MKRHLVLALLLIAACKERTETPSATSTFAPPPPSPTTQQPAPSSAEALVPRVTVADLNGWLKNGEATVIDVRAANDYIGGHVPGSLHIPLSFLEQEAPYLPRGKRIVTYCTWPAEESSARAALILGGKGIQNVTTLKGGLEAWRAAGYEVKVGREP